MALLPGSRWGEVQRLLPVMAEMVRRWQNPSTQWVLPVANTLSDELIQGHIPGDLYPSGPKPGLCCPGLCGRGPWYAPAPPTLETALLGTPFAILYKLHPLTYALAKLLVRVKHFGLANIVAGREVAPETPPGRSQARGPGAGTQTSPGPDHRPRHPGQPDGTAGTPGGTRGSQTSRGTLSGGDAEALAISSNEYIACC